MYELDIFFTIYFCSLYLQGFTRTSSNTQVLDVKKLHTINKKEPHKTKANKKYKGTKTKQRIRTRQQVFINKRIIYKYKTPLIFILWISVCCTRVSKNNISSSAKREHNKIKEQWNILNFYHISKN